MEASVETKAWLRCYRCWSTDLEVQVHYEGIHKIDPQTGERAEVVDELQEAVVQCLDCMHDQPHLGLPRRPRRADRGPLGADDRGHAVGRLVHGHGRRRRGRDVLGPRGRRRARYAAFGDHGTREFFTHVRFHKHDDENTITVHLLVELYARSQEEATEVLEEAARGRLALTSLAEESRPPAATGDDPH